MADRYWVGGTGTWDGSNTANWSTSSGGSGGASVPTSADAVIFNSSSGGATVTISGTVACLTFASPTGATVWQADPGAKIQVHGSGATVVSINNLSSFGDVLVELVYSGSVGTRTFTGPTSNNFGPELAVTAGTDTVVISNRCRGVDFTGFAGTLSNNARSLYDHLTLGAGMTVTDGANVTTFASTASTPATVIITSNGVTFNAPVALSAASKTVQMADALNTGARGITLTTSCSFDTQGFALTTASLASSETGTRTITLGASTVTISGSGTALDLTGAATTVSPGTATILMTSASAKVITCAAKTMPIIRQAGAGELTITHTGASVADLQNSNATASTIKLTAGQTLTATDLTLAGTVGNVVSLESTSAGSAAPISKASGTVSLAYVSLKDSTATGGAKFNAFTSNGNTDAGGNTGWDFGNAASLSVTEAGDSLSSAGTVAIKAAAAITEADDSVSSAGALRISAQAAITTAGDTLSSAGVLPIVGAGAIGEAGDSLVSAARLALIAAAAITEADDSLSAFGCDPIEADLSVTEADDTLTADSWVRWPIAAALAVTEAGDVAAASSSSRTWQQVAVNSESWTRVSR
jgi:hypothetical protein